VIHTGLTCNKFIQLKSQLLVSQGLVSMELAGRLFGLFVWLVGWLVGWSLKTSGMKIFSAITSTNSSFRILMTNKSNSSKHILLLPRTFQKGLPTSGAGRAIFRAWILRTANKRQHSSMEVCVVAPNSLISSFPAHIVSSGHSKWILWWISEPTTMYSPLWRLWHSYINQATNIFNTNL
jgi:hypothetical protein